MPRTRRPREVDVLIEATNTIVSDHLKNELWRLKLATNESIGECPVCMEELLCRKCSLLQACGHFLCASCFIKMVETRCPVCRK